MTTLSTAYFSHAPQEAGGCLGVGVTRAFRASVTLSPEERLILVAGSTVLGESAGIGRRVRIKLR